MCAVSDIRKESMPRKNVAMNIISAYGGGVAHLQDGVEYTAFGRDKEVRRFDQTLKMTANSSGRMEIYVGPYGVGKSFIRALFQNLSIKKNFVVMTADISRSNWFAGTKYDKQGLNLYRELIMKTAIKGMTSNAFDTILQKWYDKLCSKTNGSIQSVLAEFDRETKDCKNLPMYDDIRGAILTRFREISVDADHSEAMGFFMANLSKKKDAEAVGAKDYIRESGWFDILNTWSHLFVKAGYKGLIVMIDQVDYLLNLPKKSRQQNYEFMLSMWNAVNQGTTEYLSVCLFAADRLIDDDRKGTPMYQALDERFANANRVDTLPPEQMVGLLIKLKEIHEFAYNKEGKYGLTEEDAKSFVDMSIKDLNIEQNCLRPISMAWMKLLDDREIGEIRSIVPYVSMVKKEADRENEKFKQDNVEATRMLADVESGPSNPTPDNPKEEYVDF